MKGKIEITKSKDEEITIRLLISIKDTGAPDSNQEEIEISQDNQVFGSLKILVSENNPLDRKILVNSFENWNCNYVVATNGKDTLFELQKNKFDIILLDIHMPFIDGITIAQQVRSGKFIHNINCPIIAFSNSHSLVEKSNALSIGINEYIERPIDPQSLRTCIVKWIDRNNLIRNKREIASGFQNLKRISNGNKDFMRDILETFILETPLILSQIQEAIKNKNKKTIQVLANKISPSLELLNLGDMQKWISDLTKKAAKDNIEFDDIESVFIELEMEFEIISPQVQNQIQTLGQPI
jgi:CheY-like chemotaxis protein